MGHAHDACKVAARAANRWPSSRFHDVKQRAFLRSRGASRRPGSRFSFRVHPRRGGRSADRRTMSVVAFARRDRSARVRRGASHDAGRSPLGTPPWRFSAGGRASISGISSGSVQRAPRSQVVMPGGRCPGQPLRRSESSGDDRERPPILFRNNDLIVYYRPLMSDRRRYVSVAIPVLKPGVVILGRICSSRRNGWLCLQSARGDTTTGMA